MKLPAGLLLLCLALTVSVRAEEAAPVKKEIPEVKRELVWPEIKNPQALIDHAKNQIDAFNRDHPGVVQNLITDISHEFDYLKPRRCYIGYDCLGIVLDTHPYTGQALLVAPDPKEFCENHKYWLTGAIDTKNPEIKFVLGEISPNECGLYEYLGNESVQWADICNLDKETCSWPKPLEMRFPAFPMSFLEIGLSGRAKIVFSVSEQGRATLLQLDVTNKDLELPVRDAVQAWRFEPGVDLKTRMPTKTKMSLTVKFNLKVD